MMNTPIRVLVVDDSAFMRYTISRHLQADPDITVVGSAQDGLDALSKIPALRPDVVTLDVEMPRMDGLTALKRIMAECPTPVIMLSSLTKRGARTTIQALMRGAVDFVAKPSSSAETRFVMETLVEKVKSAAGVETVTVQIHPPPPTPASRPEPVNGGSVSLRPYVKGGPLVVIGASTGGPRALQTVLSQIPPDFPAPIAVVQHMPPGFTRSLAQRLNETCPLTVQEAVDGDRLAQGLVLLAPGDYHLCFMDNKQVKLEQGPRRNHVRPAVDVTMETAAQHYGSAVIGVILTGMGSDGTEGARQIKGVGGRIIAEDRSTTVVYGMPRSVAEADLVDCVVPLPDVASALVELVNRER